MLEDNLIIITTTNYERKLLKENKLKYNLKVYNINEFRNKYYHDYKLDTLVYMKNKYNLIPEISQIILNNLYKIENKEYKSNKLNELVKIKNDLLENGYILKNNNFRVFLEDKKIICFNTKFENFETKIEEIILKDKIEIFKYDSIEEEIIATAMKIEDLINNGVDINKIKINSLDGSYDGIFNRIFTYFNIPYELKSNNKLFYLNDIKKFLKTINNETKVSDLNNILDELNLNEEIHNKLVDILNKYSNYTKIEEFNDILLYELKNQSIDLTKYDNVIKEINYKNYTPEDDEYIFMLGLNQDIIPKIHKNDLYLSDEELEEIGDDTSVERNLQEEIHLTRFLNSTKNITISYKLNSPKQEFGYSNYLTTQKNIVETSSSYDYRNEELNKLLLADRLDNYILYNDVSKDLYDLYTNYSNLNYSIYDNNYEKIDYDIIKKQLNNKLNLSYSNITTFYKCQFRFLLENIYKISTFQETISQVIGKLFHKVLEIVYKYKRTDYDEIIDQVLLEFFPNGMSNKEEFYTEKYRKSIKELIEILNENQEKTKFENTYFEHFFSIQKENDLELKIVGFVDKILTFKDNENTYVIVIDYKTGGMHNDFKKVVHGLDMQLLMYLYLIKNTNLIKNPKYAGMYLQQIMTEVLNKDKKKTYKEQIIDNTKLNGYTIKDINIVSKIDSNFDDISFIKGMKLKKDGDFASTTKVLLNEQIDELIEIVSKNIDNAIMEINNSNFPINPKKIKNKNEGCEYCSFKDICYVNNNNIIELEIGGEDDDADSEG